MRASTVFVSYRRADAAAQAGRIVDALVEAVGAANVFIDVDSIRPGADFADAIYQGVVRADLVVVLIGRDWLQGESGLRLFQVDDYVRIEIEVALRLCKTVVPVLINGATMPRTEQLPPNIARLAHRNPLGLSDSSFRRDLTPLLDLVMEGSSGRSGREAAPAGAELIANRWHWLRYRYWVVRLDLPGGSHQLELREVFTGSVLLLDGKQVWKGPWRRLAKANIAVPDDGRATRIVTFGGSALMPVIQQSRQPADQQYLWEILVDGALAISFNWQDPDMPY